MIKEKHKQQIDWKYSGEAEELVLMSPLYLGGLPPQSSPHPPQMWSATASAGMVGCIRDLVMNGRSVQLAEVARSQDLGQYHSVYVVDPTTSILHQFLLRIRRLKGISEVVHQILLI